VRQLACITVNVAELRPEHLDQSIDPETFDLLNFRDDLKSFIEFKNI